MDLNCFNRKTLDCYDLCVPVQCKGPPNIGLTFSMRFLSIDDSIDRSLAQGRLSVSLDMYVGWPQIAIHHLITSSCESQEDRPIRCLARCLLRQINTCRVVSPAAAVPRIVQIYDGKFTFTLPQSSLLTALHNKATFAAHNKLSSTSYKYHRRVAAASNEQPPGTTVPYPK